jgi:multidrug efflux pump subunit AcrA (membrane-fusion protein)
MRASPRPWFIYAGLIGLTALAGCDDATVSQGPSERPVQVQRVTFTDADVSREFVGVVRARYETDLGFRVAGKIVARLVNVGDSVTTGQVVASLDSQDLRLQVESAEAELAAATSNLTQESAEAERYGTLKARGYAAVADFDRKQAAKDEAEGRLERARRALEMAQPAHLCGPTVRRRRGHYGDACRSRAGCSHRPGRGAAGASGREGGGDRVAGDVAR